MDQSDSVAIFVLFSSNKQRKIRGRKEMEITDGEFIISFLFLLFFFTNCGKILISGWKKEELNNKEIEDERELGETYRFI